MYSHRSANALSHLGLYNHLFVCSFIHSFSVYSSLSCHGFGMTNSQWPRLQTAPYVKHMAKTINFGQNSKHRVITLNFYLNQIAFAFLLFLEGEGVILKLGGWWISLMLKSLKFNRSISHYKTGILLQHVLKQCQLRFNNFFIHRNSLWTQFCNRSVHNSNVNQCDPSFWLGIGLSILSPVCLPGYPGS